MVSAILILVLVLIKCLILILRFFEAGGLSPAFSVIASFDIKVGLRFLRFLLVPHSF